MQSLKIGREGTSLRLRACAHPHILSLGAETTKATSARFGLVLDEALRDLRELVVSEFNSVMQTRSEVRMPNDLGTSINEEQFSSNGTLEESSARLTSHVTPLARWVSLTEQIMRPSARHYLNAQKGKKLCAHAFWLEYKAMLRCNRDKYQSEWVVATTMVADGRHESARMRSRSVASLEDEDGFMSRLTNRCVIHPLSPVKRIWVLASLLMVAYDSITTPLSAFFDIGNSSFLNLMMWLSIIFWLCDCLVSMRSGKFWHGALEMCPSRIVKIYWRTWMPFDIFSLVVDWSLLILDIVIGDHKMGSFSDAAPSIRKFRLLRLIRLLKLDSMLDHTLSINGSSVQVIWCSDVIKASIVYMLYFHILACVWYGIGISDDLGWAAICQTSTVGHCYFLSVNWAFGQLTGTASFTYDTNLELAFATFSLSVAVVLLAVFIGLVVDGVSKRRDLDKVDMRIVCAAYAQEHKIPSALRLRMLRYISDEAEVNYAKRFKMEEEMLQKLPSSLQSELLHSMRSPLLLSVSFARDLNYVCPVLIMKLCTDAMVHAIALEEEPVFAAGDIGRCWRIVESGALAYTTTIEPLQATDVTLEDLFASSNMDKIMQASLRHSALRQSSLHTDDDFAMNGREVQAGMNISEMILWATWRHTGDLVASGGCTLLQVGKDEFCEVIKERIHACLVLTRYAHQFVKWMNAIGDTVSDLHHYDPSVNELEEFDPTAGETYFIFLSHYKAEAGTEATLMQEALVKMLAENADRGSQGTVFLDSEDLTDLNELQEHVSRSENVVLLLTPGVLSRPWCLLEIVAAMNHSIQIVPVEIQRPGFQFSYPDERYYLKLRNGEMLSRSDRNMLANEGVTLKDVEDAIRFVFQQVALPFSPHKSKNIRGAELADILSRCGVSDGSDRRFSSNGSGTYTSRGSTKSSR